MFGHKKNPCQLFFIVFLFHLLLIYFVFVVQAELQLHFHNLHFEQFFKDGREGEGGGQYCVLRRLLWATVSISGRFLFLDIW